MSKTVDELLKVFNRAKWDQLRAGDYENLDRTGIAAVIRALRDEMASGAAWHAINVILGDAGEKVAGQDTAKPEAIERSKPATAPAPAVCEITAERDRLKAALEWYADENNWRDQPFLRMDHLGRECEDLSPAEIWGDNGDRARKALGGGE